MADGEGRLNPCLWLTGYFRVLIDSSGELMSLVPVRQGEIVRKI